MAWVVVSEFSVQDALRIYGVRLPIGPMAAREAFGRNTRPDLAETADNCNRVGAAADAPIWERYELSSEFRAGLTSRVIGRMLDHLWQMSELTLDVPPRRPVAASSPTTT